MQSEHTPDRRRPMSSTKIPGTGAFDPTFETTISIAYEQAQIVAAEVDEIRRNHAMYRNLFAGA